LLSDAPGARHTLGNLGELVFVHSRLNRQLQSENFQMADREMIAATLAAALIVGRNSSSTRTSVEQLAVETYQRVLAALDAAAPARAGSH
jgi:hypothetical protein